MKFIKTLLMVIPLLYCLNVSAKIVPADTLRIVREDDFLRYPFGVFNSFKSVKIQGAIPLNLKTSYIKPYQNGVSEQTKTFGLTKSYARFYADKNTKKLETVNAIILDNEMALQNGIKIGMEKHDFLTKMNIPDRADANASVVELASKDGDIHHYYRFQNDRLISIMIFSKLFYQKV